MTRDNEPKSDRSSILDLFRQELDTHTVILNDGLAALQGDPQDTERFHPLIRSIHAIKGGALIVEMTPAITMARAMEDCLTAAQK